jgi:8-oxo-dGTP pyrophosphatase MutT (NUDIX family)
MNNYLNKLGDGITCPISLIMKDGKFLVGYRNYTPDKWKKISVWTIPGGRSDLGETIEETLRREVAEEVNITDLKILDFIGEAPGAKEGDVVLVFYCTTKQDALLMEPEKFSEWRWVSLKEYEEIYISFNPEVREMIINYLTKLQ